MLNLRRIYELDFNSSVIRFLLSIYFRPGRFYKIPFGALRGIRIWYDRDINYHAILGVWEKKNFSLLRKVLTELAKEKSTVHAYDIGANIGLYSLFFSKFPGIRVHAFEPVTETLAIFKKNIDRNRMNGIQVVDRVVGEVDGEVTFYIGHHHKSSLEKDWTSDRGTKEVHEIRVPSITIDSFVKHNPDDIPDIIKIDVEGAGGLVLLGASETLRSIRPILLIESHAAYEDQAIIKMLHQFNYRAFRINNHKWIKNPGNDYHDSEGVWGTMLLLPAERPSGYIN